MRFSRLQVVILLTAVVSLIPLGKWFEAKASISQKSDQLICERLENTILEPTESTSKAEPATEEFQSYVRIFESISDDPEHACARRVGAPHSLATSLGSTTH